MTTKLTRARRALTEYPDLVERVLFLAEAERPAGPVLTPEGLYACVAPHLVGLDHEALACVALSSRSHVVDVAVLTRGTTGYTVMDPARILRWVLTRDRPARSFALAHNHPSGDGTPSREDIATTVRVQDAAAVVRVPLVDHLIVHGLHGYTSMAEEGYLPATTRSRM